MKFFIVKILLYKNFIVKKYSPSKKGWNDSKITCSLVPPDSDPIVLQRTGEVPTNSWLLAMGTIDIRDQDGDNAEDDCMTDSDVSCVLESETCTQTPSTKDYM